MALVVPVLMTVMTGLITFAMAYQQPGDADAGGWFCRAIPLAQIRTSTSVSLRLTYTALKNAAPGLNPATITMTCDLEQERQLKRTPARVVKRNWFRAHR